MKNRKEVFFIVSFLTLLILPNVLMLFGVNSWFSLNEKKNLAKMPSVSTNITAMAKGMKSYYLDNFGYKNLAYKAYEKTKVNLLNEYPLPNKVVRGKEGWLFLGDYGKNVFSNNVGVKEIDLSEKKSIESNIDRFFEKSTELEIPFYYVVCPDKHQIYSEYLPFQLKNQISKFDGVLGEIVQKYPQTLILKEALLLKKRQGNLYHKTDTHWNDLGALYGFNEIIKKLKPTFPVLEKVKSFRVVKKTVFQQDLSTMIDVKIKEDIAEFKIKNLKSIQEWDTVNGVEVNRIKNPEKKLKVLIFHDSYSNALMKYFELTFGESVFVKSTPNYNLIKREEPDLVILQMVNRKIETLCTKQLF